MVTTPLTDPTDVKNLTLQELDILLKHSMKFSDSYSEAEKDTNSEEEKEEHERYHKLTRIYSSVSEEIRGEIERRLVEIWKQLGEKEYNPYNPYFDDSLLKAIAK